MTNSNVSLKTTQGRSSEINTTVRDSETNYKNTDSLIEYENLVTPWKIDLWMNYNIWNYLIFKK